MVLEIVRQAVEIKLKSRTESPLISEAEYCCACGISLREAGADKALLEKAKTMETVEEAREAFQPVFQKAFEAQEENTRLYRLYHLLLHTRVKGKITDEIRVLFD